MEELKNEVAELRQDAEELRQRLKEAEVALSSLADDAEERASTTEAILTWCEEQEIVLARHRDVVAAMGAATRMLQTEGAAGDAGAGDDVAGDAGAGLSPSDQPSADDPGRRLRPPPRWDGSMRGNT